MRSPASRIRDKITIPFILLAFAGIAATALLSVNLVADVIEERFERQLIDASAVVSRSEYARNPAILERVKTIVDAEVLTFLGNEAIASTLDAAGQQVWIAALAAPDAVGPGALPAGPMVKQLEVRGRPFTIVCRPVGDDSGTLVAVMKETSDVAEAKRAVNRQIAVLGVVMAVLVSLISHLVTRTITSPLQKLARASRNLAAGQWDAMVGFETGDEVSELAHALNEMAGELRRSEEKLLRSEKLSVAGQLAARVAHDIRNPLSSIKLRAQMVCDRLPSGSSERASLDPILKDIEQVEWVVQGLLDLARPAKLQLEEASVNEVVEDVLASIGAHLEHARVEVEWEFDPDLPWIPLDAGRLKQALLNLVLNAAEAMPEGGRLGVRTGFEDDPEGVVIEIWDIGEGIDTSAREKLFDPFFTTKREGVGLGLVNARSLVESHGGSLELLPRDGGGTRAIVRLPLESEAEPPGEEGDSPA